MNRGWLRVWRPDTGKGNPQKWLKDNIPSLNGRYGKAEDQKRMSAQIGY